MSAADPITTSLTHREGIAVVSIGGEIDLSTAPAFEAAIAGALKDDPSVLVIDLSEVSFMASVGVRILSNTHENLGKLSRLAVVANSPATRRPIELLDLDKMVALHPTLDDAVTAMGIPPTN